VDNQAFPSPFLDLQTVLRDLRGRVGAWCALGLLSQALGLLLFGRLGAVMLRMERMTARFLAGRLWRIEGRVAREACVVGQAAGNGGVRIWPGGFVWLVKMAGWQSAGYGSQLRAVLETPEMVALLAAAPQAGRVLRPICRALGIETSVLRPGVVVEPRVEVVRERVRQARAKGRVTPPWRVPLPRGVLSAARRAGCGKIPSD
jgi:hypothetical protein